MIIKKITAVLAAVLCAAYSITGVCADAFKEQNVMTPMATDEQNDITEENVATHGRVYFDSNGINFNWSMSGFSFSFTGTGATLTVRSRGSVRLAVYVDGSDTGKNISLRGGRADYVLAEGLEDADHTIDVRKVTENDWGGAASATVIKIHGGTLNERPEAAKRHIEFIGDSVTTAYGSLISDGSINYYRAEDQDATLSYATLTAKKFGAEFSIVAKSGIGFAFNDGGGTENTMSDAYGFTDYFGLDKQTEWDFEGNPNDIVVIALGDNDSTSQNSAGILAGAKSFISLVREKNPDAFIIWAYGICTLAYDYNIKQAVSEANAAGDSNIVYMRFDPIKQTAEGIGAAGHPSALTHENNAEKLSAFITEKTGWQPGTDGSADTSVLTLNEKTDAVLGAHVLSRVKPGTKRGELNCFAADNVTAVFGADGKELLADEVLYTGCVVKRLFGGRVLDTRAISVTGDANGDGNVTANDALIALQAAVGKINSDEAVTAAVSLGGTGSVTAADALKILQFAVNKINTL